MPLFKIYRQARVFPLILLTVSFLSFSVSRLSADPLPKNGVIPVGKHIPDAQYARGAHHSHGSHDTHFKNVTNSKVTMGTRDYGRDYKRLDSLIAIIETHEGAIRINLLFKQAPNTVANFEYHIKRGFYDGVIFHRVIQQFMIQTGDSSGTGKADPGFRILQERSHLSHEIGMVSMANSGDPDSGGTQFFILQYPQPHLDGKHTIFGQVIDGLDVIYRIEKGDPMIKVSVIEVKLAEEEL